MSVVNTFGLGPAAYWWSRVHAGAHHLLYHLLSASAWGMVYVDVGFWFLDLTCFWEEAALLQGIHEAFGIPLAWKKVGAGLVQAWVGFHVSLTAWAIGTTPSRLEDLVRRARPPLTQQSGPRPMLESLVGKLGQVLQALGAEAL